MEKLARRIKEAENALDTLREVLREPYTVIVRDATIQRFEYTFERQKPDVSHLCRRSCRWHIRENKRLLRTHGCHI